eukprot:3885573-Prymnesium_polylepis.1
MFSRRAPRLELAKQRVLWRRVDSLGQLDRRAELDHVARRDSDGPRAEEGQHRLPVALLVLAARTARAHHELAFGVEHERGPQREARDGAGDRSRERLCLGVLGALTPELLVVDALVGGEALGAH